MIVSVQTQRLQIPNYQDSKSNFYKMAFIVRTSISKITYQVSLKILENFKSYISVRSLDISLILYIRRTPLRRLLPETIPIRTICCQIMKRDAVLICPINRIEE